MRGAVLIRTGAWVVLVLSAVFFLTTGGTYPGIASVDGHVLGQLIAIAVLGGWCVVALVRPAWRPSSPLLLPVALAAAAYILSAIFSQRPRLSFEPTIAGLGWALALLFLSRLLAEPWFRARAAVVMTAFVAVVAFGYIGQVVLEWIAWWGVVGRFAVPPLRPSFAALFLGSPNLIGTALVLLAPLVVTIMWGPGDNRARRGVATALAVGSGLAIFLSGSRGAWVGVAIGVVLALALSFVRGGPRQRVSLAGIRTRARRQPILLVPVLALLVAAAVLAPAVAQRFAQGGATLRIDLWRSALSIFAEHPILGAGPGTWVQLKVAANPPGVPNLILPHAHDMYVQAAAELGVVGLLAGAFLALAVARRLWAGWRSTATSGAVSNLRPEAGAVIVSLGAFAGQSIVDNLSNLPFVILIVVLLVAWVDGGLTASTPAAAGARVAVGGRRVDLRLAVPIVGLVGFALLIPNLLRIDRAASVSLVGNAAALRGHWQEALGAYNQARFEDPGFTLYEIQAASALARLGRTAEARDTLAQVVESDPLAINLLGLAALESDLGNREDALAHLHRAIELGVGEPTVALNAGLIADRLEQPDLALEQFAIAVALDPPLISSGIWESPPRSATKAEVINQASTHVDGLERMLILAYGGSPGSARSELEAFHQDNGRWEAYRAACDWLEGNPSRALHRLGEWVAFHPDDWFAASWAARIARISRMPDEQNRFSKWALTVQGDAAALLIPELSVVPASFDAAGAALPGNYPWGIYLRPISPYLTMPQLVLIGAQ